MHPRLVTQVLTSLLRLNLDGVGKRPVSHRGEGQDPDCIGFVLEKAAHRGQEAVVHVVLLPVADRLIRLHGIIYTIATDLPVGLHRFLPLDDHGGAAQHSSLHITGGTGRSLFPRASDHRLTGRPLPDAVDCRDPDLVLRVGAEPPNTVACGGDVLFDLIGSILAFRLVFNDIVGHRVWISRVPGDGDTCRCRLCHHWRPRSLGEC